MNKYIWKQLRLIIMEGETDWSWFLHSSSYTYFSSTFCLLSYPVTLMCDFDWHAWYTHDMLIYWHQLFIIVHNWVPVVQISCVMLFDASSYSHWPSMSYLVRYSSQTKVKGRLSGTLMPLGPWGPLGADKMDPSAAMVTPGSPFSPCAKKGKIHFYIPHQI